MRFSIKNNAVVHLTTVMWRHAIGNRKWVILYALMSLLAMFLGLMLPLVMGNLMNAAQQLTGDALANQAYWSLSEFVLLGVAFWMLHGPSRVIETQMSFLVRLAFQTRIFHEVTSLPMKWHKNHHSGETIDQIARATVALSEFTETGFETIHLFTRFVGSAILLTWLMPVSGGIIAVVTAIVLITVVAFDRVLVDQYRSLNKRYNQIAATIQDYLTNVSTIISLRLEQRVGKEVHERTSKILPLVRKNTITNEWKWFTTSRFVDCTQAGVLLLFIVIAARTNKTVEIGTLYALSEYLRSIGDSFFQLTWKYGDLVMKSTRVRGVSHIEESFNVEVRGSETATLLDGWQQLEIKNVTFSHNQVEGSTELASIQNVSATFERGKSYALVGESGSGKSTFLHLLRGLHRTQVAEVVCDGIVQPYALTHVAHCTTLIPQDPEIFSDTIRFNVSMGVETSDAAVLDAIRLAKFENVLARLPKGLEASIAEKGINLSGGEKQRLALARGIFFAEDSDSDIILFDESTSSVDIFNERLIYESLIQKYKDRCVISAIHKFNLLKYFDEVLVFVAGQIVERGSVSELLAQNGELARLWGKVEVSSAG